MKQILNIIRLKWSEYLIEIFVIIIGVISAFMLDGLGESRNVRQLEQVYLQEILRNIKSDKAQLSEVIKSQSANKVHFQTCVDILSKSDIDLSALESEFGLAFEHNDTFFPQDGGYLSLLSEGGMKIIDNKTLSSSITNLYEHWYQRLIYNGELLDQRVSNILLESQEYYMHETKSIYHDDIKMTKILPNIYYLIRSKRVYLTKAHDTLEAVKEIEVLIEKELGD